MTDDGIKAALLALTAKTKSGQLRELLPLIEAKLAAGVRHEDILAALGQHGFSMSMAAYKTTLYRIRKERMSNPARPPAAPSGAPAEAPPATASAPETPPTEVNELPSDAGKTAIQRVMEKPAPKFSYKAQIKKDQS